MYPAKLHTIIKFESIEAMQAFGADKELTETRKQAWLKEPVYPYSLVLRRIATNLAETSVPIGYFTSTQRWLQ
jgi:hypothetical protein